MVFLRTNDATYPFKTGYKPRYDPKAPKLIKDDASIQKLIKRATDENGRFTTTKKPSRTQSCRF